MTEMNGMPLPNLEAPNDLISDLKHQPVPACFGVSAPHWLPRSTYVGTYDEKWRTQRAPYLPKDYDRRFLNMAHSDLVYPGYLTGGEPVEITHMHPNGMLKFNVPVVNLSTEVVISEESVHPEFNLETVIIEPNQLRLSIVWRAAVPCDKKALKISDVNIRRSR